MFSRSSTFVARDMPPCESPGPGRWLAYPIQRNGLLPISWTTQKLIILFFPVGPGNDPRYPLLVVDFTALGVSRHISVRL